MDKMCINQKFVFFDAQIVFLKIQIGRESVEIRRILLKKTSIYAGLEGL